jgi:Hydrazine synthase alpha subunit middle domain
MKIRTISMRVSLVLHSVVAAFAATTVHSASSPSTKAVSLSNPILFVTQVPTPGEVFASRGSTFANHLSSIGSVPRGGDLMIRYPDGALRNLTQEAGYGENGRQGANAIAVREPAVHWSGNKALFSMVVGAPTQQYQQSTVYWQIYEVSGLGMNEPVTITKVAGQPTTYNNVSPLYDTKDNILFTSDRPRDGSTHLHPQLDEYESTPTITGLWRLDPATRELRLLNHTPSGLFSPTVDSFGRIVFIRWDHLQRDQQADGSPGNGYIPQTFATEAANSATIANTEVFPESRLGQTSAAYGNVLPFTFNLFQPWEINEDGTAELTLNHLGRHELSFGYLGQSFTDDPSLQESSNTNLIANRRYIRGDGGIFQLREDPIAPGRYFGVYAREFASLASGTILRFNAAPTLNAEQIAITDVTAPEGSGGVPGGRFRNPLPLTSGKLLAAHSTSTAVNSTISFQIKEVVAGSGATMVAGDALTSGIQKSLSWWSPDSLVTYSGLLWELEPVEVVARTRPIPRTSPIETVEQQVLSEESVDEMALRNWMERNDVALIVTRNQTSRDRGDRQQPFNLRVPGGVSTTATGGKTYDIAHYQILQADQVRGYQGRQGRRSLPRPIAAGKNPANAQGPLGSVRIASDGSAAAFVPAKRALTWQTTDANGEPVVRERVWVTLQPGEIRTCAGCHGANSRDQAGNTVPAPTNKPQALRDLLAHWKSIGGSSAALPFDIDGNGVCDSNTDAVLMIRYLKGIRGEALTKGLSFGGFAARKTHDAITLYLDSIAPTLDIDGDGNARSTTDALMFLRYTKQLTSTALTSAAQNAQIGGGMKTPAEIKNYFDSKCLPTP